MTVGLVDQRTSPKVGDLSIRIAWVLVGVGAIILALAQPGSIGTLFLYAVLAQSWNLIGGLAGYASFGQVVFFGIGGYAAALAMDRLGMSFWVAFPFGGLVAGSFGLIFGDLVLRVRGLYFAVATIALAQAAKTVITSWPGLAGQSGVLTIATVGLHTPTPRPSAFGFDTLFVAVALVATLVVAWIGRTRLGDALSVIRDDEDLAGTLGIAVRPAKVVAFTLSATVAGLAGGIYAFQVVSLSPSALFAPLLSVVMVAAVIAGGTGVLRPLRGAVLLWLMATGLGHLLPPLAEVFAGGFVAIVIMVERRRRAS